MSRLVYTALSKHSYYANMNICAFVFQKGAVPLNPFNMFGYFLFDLIDRQTVRNGNESVIRKVDAVWCFGPISDGIVAEVRLACHIGLPVTFYSVGSRMTDIGQIGATQLLFEENISRADREMIKSMAGEQAQSNDGTK